jgi:arginyl-tRNA synthetase
MIRAIEEKIDSVLQKLLKELYGLENFPIPEAQYPRPEMGDLSYTLAFPLAKLLRKGPRQIAEQLVSRFSTESVPGVRKLEIGGNGYLNFHLDRVWVALELSQKPVAPESVQQSKAIVEHTNINPNKAAHVGHLRNACLGDMLVRLLRFMGMKVEVQNYIDDTGVQLADVVVGFQAEGKGIADLDQIPGRIDYYFWDLYARTHETIQHSEEYKALRVKTLKAMEEREEPVFSLSQAIADRIIRAHLGTTARLGIDYELLPRESDIIGLHFWEKTFLLLKARNVVRRVDEGKNAGCWVMSLAGSEEFEDMQNPDKILVRSNGTVTYAGKDIAYQLWKFGLLGSDFHYRIFDRKPNGHIVWTTSTTQDDPAAPDFGIADIVYNVIDQRQSYLQRVVAEGLRALGHGRQADNSIHFSYEMVALSQKAARELGFELSEEEQQKAFVEMSGRRGLGVKADDLLDRLEQKAYERAAPLYKDLDPKVIRNLASAITSGALRYFMIRYTRNTLITFDLDEALNFEGETGPYLQYSMVRAQSILRKLKASGFNLNETVGEDAANAIRLLQESDQESEDSWSIILGIIRIKDVITRALRSLEISYFSKHIFELAQLFNNYYHKYPVLHEADPQRKLLRITITRMFIDGMRVSLDLLGIPVPSRM